MDEPGAPLQEIASWCQTLVALGGDGTALLGARALVGRRGALLPINLGGLGFLTVAESREADAALDSALGDAWPTARRGMVSARLIRGDRTIRRGVAMNDAVIKGASGFAAIHLRLRALEHDLGLLVADGLIIATAAGSTAYSLSAGGPLLTPDVEALVVTPVCAHSLGSRSMVLPPDAEVAVRVIGGDDRGLLVLDGQDRVELMPRDRVHARLVRDALRVYQNPERSFARALQAKLGWQGSAKRSR
jgi:NAD+ kinase